MEQWTYKLDFQSAASVFSGLAVAGLVDRMIVRNGSGLPFIPGSTVKGRWRFFAERLLYSLEREKQQVGLKIHPKNGPFCKDRATACSICKIFGNPTLPSLIFISQAELDNGLQPLFQELLDQNPNPVMHPDAELRPGIALSRVRRSAMPDHLFFDEALPPAVFHGKILVNGELSESEVELLSVSAALVDSFGGRKAVGRGLLRKGIQINNIKKEGAIDDEDHN